MKKIFFSILSLILLTFGASQIVQADEYLRIGMEAAYAPFNWTQDDDSNGAVKIDGTNQYANGYDVQVAKKIAKELGKKPLIVKTSWNGLIPALTSGKIDMIIAGMSPTEERKKLPSLTVTIPANQLFLSKKMERMPKPKHWMILRELKSPPNKEFTSTI